MKALALVTSTAVLLVLATSAMVAVVYAPSIERAVRTGLGLIVFGAPFLAYCMSVVRPLRRWRIAAKISNLLILLLVIALAAVTVIGVVDIRLLALTILIGPPLIVNLLALRATPGPKP